MMTIKQIMEEFLKEQKGKLKPGTYKGYEESIFLFEDCLNGYAYQALDEKEAKKFDKLYDEGKQFCDVFGPDKISGEISHFLNYFIIRKVMCSKEFMKTVGRVMKKFVKWLNEKGYIDEAEYEFSTETVADVKNELPAVEELSELLFEYTEYSEPVKFTETLDGYFEVTKIEPGRLWFDNSTGTEKNIGPVIVPEEISSKCRVGWTICLALGKTKKGWRMLESGNVYPR